MAEQKKPTGAPVRKRKSAAKTASPVATVTEKAEAPAKASKRKTSETMAAPLFDAPTQVAPVDTPAPALSKIAAPEVIQASVQAVAPARLADVGAVKETYARTQVATASLRQVVAETTTATTAGALEINDKVLDAFRAQSDAVLDLWRSALE